MLFRFSLYGFLKNQQYYDPFLILAFLDKGLSFALIGLLIGFREICVNVMEIPTGAIADVAGRRRAMIFSHLGYIVAFLVFAFADGMPLLLAAMFFFSIGEAFRTGTHKAIIFAWLDREGRADQKTSVYGFTRSWSKLGSALSVIIAAGLVFWLEEYRWVFLLSIVPYVANIVNFLTYPAYLDGEPERSRSIRQMTRTLLSSVRDSLGSRPLRRLLTESMGFEGTYKVCKDYLQPVIKAAALALPLMVGHDDRQRTAVLVGGVYCVLYVVSSIASRKADAVRRRAGDEQRGARWLWWGDFGIFVALAVGVAIGRPGIAIAAFVLLSILQNFWRPILISRVADRVDPQRTATVLSIESQAKALFAAVMAPLTGLAVDFILKAGPALGVEADKLPETLRFLPVGLIGVLVAGIMLATAPRGNGKSQPALTEANGQPKTEGNGNHA
ncbi:MAG: MFS transporter [Phycisphaerae bacterium]